MSLQFDHCCVNIVDATLVMFVFATDIDECAHGTDNCSQMCNNTIGSYICSCQLDYYLSADSVTCLGMLLVANQAQEA